jgi:hypothetical protein
MGSRGCEVAEGIDAEYFARHMLWRTLSGEREGLWWFPAGQETDVQESSRRSGNYENSWLGV